MADKRRGLGRGLGALIPPAPATSAAGTTESADSVPPASGTSVTTDQSSTPAVKKSHGQGPAAQNETATRRPKSTPTVEVQTGRRGNAIRPVDVFFSQQVTDQRGKGATAGSVEVSEPHDQADSIDRASSDTVAREVSRETNAKDVSRDVSRETAEPDGLVPVPGASFALIEPLRIRPNPQQPRTVFDPVAMNELVHSIREVGVLQPIVVRPIEDATHDFELIMGERRWRASQKAGIDAIPTIIRETKDDDLLRDALLENLHRSELNPLEEAAAYEQLLRDFQCTHVELAQRIGRSRPQITNTVRLLKLPATVQGRVVSGALTAGHARALLTLTESPEVLEKVASRVIAEGLSVRSTEEVVSVAAHGHVKPARKKDSALAGPSAEAKAFNAEQAERLEELFDTRVTINGVNKGKISIDYSGREDLVRLLELMLGEGQV